MPAEGACGCGHLLCEWCGNPATPVRVALVWQGTGDYAGQTLGVHDRGQLLTWDDPASAKRWARDAYPQLWEHRRINTRLVVELDGDWYYVVGGDQVRVVVP
jgi:hypothetical protein